MLHKTDDTYIGVDLGGTKLLIGEMDETGRIRRARRTPSQGDMIPAFHQIEAELKAFLAERTNAPAPKAIGVSIAGIVNSDQGVWIDWRDGSDVKIPVAKAIHDSFGIECFCENDVKCATIAEAFFGEGKDRADFIYINVGTGLSAGIVLGGRLVKGGHYNAGEVGHVASGLNLGMKCECGRADCAELYASGRGVARCVGELIGRFPDTRLTRGCGAREVFALAGEDDLANLIADNAARALSSLIMDLTRMSDPDLIVLGGGVVSDGHLIKRVNEYLAAQRHTMRYVTAGVRLTSLDPDAMGLMGACANAIIRLNKKEGLL